MVIHRLPPEVVNQIAAGEVVERPGSLVKELVENALDAGAARVRVEIRGGGADSVVVVDDGHGFLPADLPLAFASHATSKLSALADLDHIGSLGFRGEALASIGAVARCSIQSRRHDQDAGYEARCDGGKESAVAPCGCPPGTRIEVRELFFNTPARRRFLKSAAAEKAKVQELLCEQALARLDVDFTLLADGKQVLRLPAGESLADRFARCFGEELRRGLLPVERTFGNLQVRGLVAEPDLARRDGRLELLYVNGRRAGERSVLQAVRQAYREYVMGGRLPVYVLQLQLPPDQVDANVHPRKSEVRLLESRRVAGCLYSAVQGVLQARAGAAGAGGVVLSPELPRARSGFPELPADLFGRPVAAMPPWPLPAPAATVRDGPPAAAAGGALPNPFARVSGRFLQVLELYLLLEAPDGLLVVDQHALHERVVYERLQRQHRGRAVAVQRLLAPA
ncbi:MAG TPA: DNA mismatch repair endonuclease MutL, partial [Planctomycetota bacterium]|nr:DNA mismatch repair endonuclease MutL [Planctomycetota bacterium]